MHWGGVIPCGQEVFLTKQAAVILFHWELGKTLIY